MKHLLTPITLLLLSTLAFGQVPNTFSSGETISSSKINANFSFLADAMQSEKITAKMICNNYGFVDLENSDLVHGDQFNSPDIVYVSCLTNDNNSLKSMTVCGYQSVNSGWCYQPSDYNRSITSTDLINNGWFLHLLNHQNHYIFYKVSSD